MEEDKQSVNKNEKTFVEEYEKLCKEYGFQIVAYPSFLPTNHGTYEIGINYTVREVKKQ